MDGAFANRKRGFFHRFRASRMGVAGPRQIIGGTAKLHQNSGFVDHFARFAADNMHAEDPVGLRICENLHKPVSRLVDLGAAVGGEREFAGGISYTSLFQLFLGLADGGDFRRCIHNARNDVVIHVAGLTGQNFSNRDAFILGLVCQHWTGNDIADRIDALQARGEMRIDLHAAAIVERDTSFLQTEALGVRDATDADQHDVRLDLFHSSTRRRLNLGNQRLARGVDARNLGAKLERETLLLEDALELLGDLAVHAGQDAIEKFDHGDLRAQTVPHRTEFKPDDAGADDQELARYLVERQRAGRRHDTLFVDLDAFETRDIRSRCNDDVPGLDGLGLAVVA